MIGSDSWCPYECFDNGRPEGITIDILKHIFEPKGYRVDMVKVPWARAVEDLRTGTITTFGSADTENAPDMIFASEPTTLQRNTIFKRTSDPWQYKNFESLQEGSLGIIHKYTYGDKIDAHISKHPRLIEKTYGEIALKNMILMLKEGRTRFFVDDRIAGAYRISQMGFSKAITPASPDVTSVPLYFGFSPQNPDAPMLAKTVSEELVRMRKDGTLNKIFARYGAEAPVIPVAHRNQNRSWQ